MDKKARGWIKSFGYGMTGIGTGFALKSLLSDYAIKKEDKENELKNKFLSKMPWILGLPGAVYGFVKSAGLNSDAKPFEHSRRAIDFILKNDGRAIIAHATGAGKTFTSIAGFEKLRDEGKATRALVVVPASLKDNYVGNIKRFTNSSYAIYGAKNEKGTKYIDERSDADFNIISYEMFKKDPEAILANTGADTLIIDEVHRARDDQGKNYEILEKMSPKFRNVITLTGSIVNNSPSDIAPLLGITYGNLGIVSNKKAFDKTFVGRREDIHGFLRPKTVTSTFIMNKPHLARLLKDKVDFVTHKDLEASMPKKDEEIVEIELPKQTAKLLNYAMSTVDPLTAWKIRNNIPVGHKEAQGMFSQLMLARQVLNDPSILDERLKGVNPEEYSPKFKRIADDLVKELDADPKNKVVIYGNLVKSQIEPMSKVLDARGISYGKFIGAGNDGVTATGRKQDLDAFMNGDLRVLLLSGAGGEGLDLKNASMIQMIEGHYNPEKIQQAEARIRRMSADGPSKTVRVKKYIAKYPSSGLTSLAKSVGLNGGSTTIDQWIYTVADAKDNLNEEFRGVLKSASYDEFVRKVEVVSPVAAIAAGRAGSLANALVERRAEKIPEQRAKQVLHNIGESALTAKTPFKKVYDNTKIPQRGIDLDIGFGAIGMGLPIVLQDVRIPGTSNHMRLVRAIAPIAIGGSMPFLGTSVKNKILASMSTENRMRDAVDVYKEKRKKQLERKYKNSGEFIKNYDRITESGLDVVEAGL